MKFEWVVPKSVEWNYLVINALEKTADATIGSRSVLVSIFV